MSLSQQSQVLYLGRDEHRPESKARNLRDIGERLGGSEPFFTRQNLMAKYN